MYNCKAGDFNPHHISFRGIKNNIAGTILSEAINLECLRIIDGSPTLLRRHNRYFSAVDISICSCQ